MHLPTLWISLLALTVVIGGTQAVSAPSGEAFSAVVEIISQEKVLQSGVSLVVSASEDSGLHTAKVIATRRLRKGTVLLDVPESLALKLSKVQGDVPADAFQEAVAADKKKAHRVVLARALVDRRRTKGSKAPLDKYVKHMSVVDIAADALQATGSALVLPRDVAGALKKRRNVVDGHMEMGRKHQLTGGKKYSDPAMAWAISLLAERSVQTSEGLALLPGVDLARVSHLRPNAEVQGTRLVATRDIEDGEEILRPVAHFSGAFNEHDSADSRVYVEVQEQKAQNGKILRIGLDSDGRMDRDVTALRLSLMKACHRMQRAFAVEGRPASVESEAGLYQNVVRELADDLRSYKAALSGKWGGLDPVKRLAGWDRGRKSKVVEGLKANYATFVESLITASAADIISVDPVSDEELRREAYYRAHGEFDAIGGAVLSAMGPFAFLEKDFIEV